MAVTEFDPSEGPSPEQQEAEANALKQGELIANAQEEDRARKYAQADAENEDAGLIGGKFKSQDDLLRAYQELQKKLGEKTPDEEEEPAEEPTEAPEEAPVEDEEEEAVEVSETVTLMEKLGAEFAEKGALDDASVEQLAALDSKELINAYLQYYQKTAAAQQQATIEASTINAIKESVGGDRGYTEMIQWAGENLSQQEIGEFNSVTDSGNVAAIKFAVAALYNRYRGSEGYEAELVTGKKADSVKGYRSHAELSRDIADPRYSKDPAFRADVEARLARSKDLL
jgi:hypothetical protein